MDHTETTTPSRWRPDDGARFPIASGLAEVHARFRNRREGAVATYIPELAKADPGHPSSTAWPWRTTARRR